jgi:hypothetical protein
MPRFGNLDKPVANGIHLGQCLLPIPWAGHSVRFFSDIQQLRSETSTAMRYELLEVPLPQLTRLEPATRKRGHEDAHTEISSDTHHSANPDNNHNAYDTGDEDPRPAKRRKPRPAPAMTSATCRGHTLELHAGQAGPLAALSTTDHHTWD